MNLDGLNLFWPMRGLRTQRSRTSGLFVWSGQSRIENWRSVGCACQLGCLSFLIECSRWLPPHGTPNAMWQVVWRFVQSSTKTSSYGRSAKLFGISQLALRCYSWSCLDPRGHSLGPRGCYLVLIIGVVRIPRRGEHTIHWIRIVIFRGGEMAAPGY